MVCSRHMIEEYNRDKEQHRDQIAQSILSVSNDRSAPNHMEFVYQVADRVMSSITWWWGHFQAAIDEGGPASSETDNSYQGQQETKTDEAKPVTQSDQATRLASEQPHLKSSRNPTTTDMQRRQHRVHQRRKKNLKRL